jgi:hypothetical protein
MAKTSQAAVAPNTLTPEDQARLVHDSLQVIQSEILRLDMQHVAAGSRPGLVVFVDAEGEHTYEQERRKRLEALDAISSAHAESMSLVTEIVAGRLAAQDAARSGS